MIFKGVGYVAGREVLGLNIDLAVEIIEYIMTWNKKLIFNIYKNLQFNLKLNEE